MSLSSSYFPATYLDARNRFLRSAKACDMRLSQFLHPTHKGPSGEDLYIDVATDKDEGECALLTISGTHGVEAYAGSAIQTAWLDQQTHRQSDIKQVFIHALNPYGFAWNRRVTEDNVDLNRNFVDHNGPYPANADYDKLRNAIAPPDLLPETLEASSKALRAYAKEHGAFAMQETISKGQYTQPAGLYFGGTREQWSAATFKEILRRELHHARRVAIVDIHTGLGTYGHAEFISEDTSDSPAFKRARAWWGDAVRSTLSGDSVSASVRGSIDSAVPPLLQNAEVTMICLEFGTYSTLEVFQALRADNWLHTKNKCSTPETASIQSQLRRAFFPDQDDWKEMVLQRGISAFHQAIKGLKSS